MPNIGDMFPGNYLKAADLNGRTVVVTIDRVEFEAVGQRKEMKAVVYFVGKTKGIICNKTNANKIMEITGSALTEEWPGHAIALYPTETEFAGSPVPCLRVKAVAKMAATEKPKPLPPPTEPITDSDIPF